MKAYETVTVDFDALWSGMTPAEAESLVGKTVAKVSRRENSLTVVFGDGSTVEVKGHTFGDSPLNVEYDGP